MKFNVLHGVAAFILPWWFFLPAWLPAQQIVMQDSFAIRIAVLDFKNNTGHFALDELEKTVPEMLKTELSRSARLVVVERQRLEGILQEQALGQAGVIDDKTAQAVGQLLGAQFLINGEISLVDERLRIDCHLLKVESGQVRGEKVIGRDRHVISEMINLLAANILFNLLGEGRYIEKRQMRHYPTAWFLWASAATAAATGVTHWVSRDAYDKYQSATRLDDFDKNYDRSVTFRNVRNGLAIATGVMGVTTLVFWLKERSADNQIIAATEPLPRILFYATNHKMGLQLRLDF